VLPGLLGVFGSLKNAVGAIKDIVGRKEKKP
jgi:hypothetical protein